MIAGNRSPTEVPLPDLSTPVPTHCGLMLKTTGPFVCQVCRECCETPESHWRCTGAGCGQDVCEPCHAAARRALGYPTGLWRPPSCAPWTCCAQNMVWGWKFATCRQCERGTPPNENDISSRNQWMWSCASPWCRTNICAQCGPSWVGFDFSSPLGSPENIDIYDVVPRRIWPPEAGNVD